MIHTLDDEYYSFSNAVKTNDNVLLATILEFTIDYSESHYVSEKAKENLFSRLKAFINNLIISLREFKSELITRIESAQRTKEIDKKIREFHDKMKEDQKDGITTTEMIDLWKYKEVYLEMNDKLWEYAKKFSKISYTKTWQIEDDMKEFDKIVDEYRDKIERIQNTKITVDIQKAIDFYEDEIRGKGEVISTLNDAMSKFQEMRDVADNLEKRMEHEGADVIPKHMSFIRKMSTSISNSIHKNVVKIIVTICLIF